LLLASRNLIKNWRRKKTKRTSILVLRPETTKRWREDYRCFVFHLVATKNYKAAFGKTR